MKAIIKLDIPDFQIGQKVNIYFPDTMMIRGVVEKEIECEDAISRQVVDEIKELMTDINGDTVYAVRMSDIRQLPSVTPQQKIGHCKECKYFEYDSMARVDGIPLIVAHEICNKWGDGCKTNENGYCFLFEPQERSKE